MKPFNCTNSNGDFCPMQCANRQFRLNVNARTGITVRAEGLLCLNDNARTVIPVRAYISRKYRQTHSVTRKGGHCDNDRPKLGITNFGVPVRKRGLTMRAMRLAMRARGLTLRALKFIAKNAHMGSPIARTNVARIMLLTYTLMPQLPS